MCIGNPDVRICGVGCNHRPPTVASPRLITNLPLYVAADSPGECTISPASAPRLAETFRRIVGAYGLTNGSSIVEALIRAKQRGIDVRLIADKTTPCERNSAVGPLAAAGVPIWIDDQARIAHAKTMVIDGTVTLTGSYNWTRGAAANSENLNLISSHDVAAAYAAHWRQRLAVSIRFDRKEDWCRIATTEAR